MSLSHAGVRSLFGMKAPDLVGLVLASGTVEYLADCVLSQCLDSSQEASAAVPHMIQDKTSTSYKQKPVERQC